MATASASTGHIRKRPFQPSITSYFSNRDTDPNATSRPNRTTSPLSPPLPADTQASLLSVGMRVRKSVPEGYKTHKTLGTDGFPFPSTAQPAPTAPHRSSHSGTSTRELQPLCGLHKTGGWAAQDVPPSSAPAAMEGDGSEYGDLPGLTMSQNTLSSTQNSFMYATSGQSNSSRKRAYEDEVEEDMDALFDDSGDAEKTEVSMHRTDRPIASMKSSLRKGRTNGVVRVVGEDDFDEAAFLAPPDGMDVDES